MRRLLTLCLVLPVAFGLAPNLSAAQSIAVSGNQFDISCPTASIGPVTMYVVVNLSPGACGGITGAEFRIQGMPGGPEGRFFVQSEPRIPELRNPFVEGARITHTCRTSETDFVSVLSMTFFATTSVTHHPVTITAHSMPSVPQFTCPIIRLCDAPVFTALCATPIETQINSNFSCTCHGDCGPFCPTVGTEAGTWSKMKQLFGG